MRRMIEFACAGEALVGTLDAPAGGAERGLLIGSGGNEIRSGAHRGMAELSARLANAGIATFRFDRRGIGDSSGQNFGFNASADDISAAVATFRASHPSLKHITAFGNCDAATALALFHQEAGIDALVLSNPWPGDEPDALPAAPAIAAHYVERLKQPREWVRLFTGQVSFGKLFSGLTKLFRSRTPVWSSAVTSVDVPTSPPRYAAKMAAALRQSGVRTTILLAEHDNTALAFRADWEKLDGDAPWPVHTLDSASHSYAAARDKQWLFERVLEAARAD